MTEIEAGCGFSGHLHVAWFTVKQDNGRRAVEEQNNLLRKLAGADTKARLLEGSTSQSSTFFMGRPTVMWPGSGPRPCYGSGLVNTWPKRAVAFAAEPVRI